MTNKQRGRRSLWFSCASRSMVEPMQYARTRLKNMPNCVCVWCVACYLVEGLPPLVQQPAHGSCGSMENLWCPPFSIPSHHHHSYTSHEPLLVLFTPNKLARNPQENHDSLPSGEAGYRAAWDMAISEFNGFGLAATSTKYRIDKNQSNLMFGFKASSQSEGHEWNKLIYSKIYRLRRCFQ